MYRHDKRVDPARPLVELRNVSKCFALDRGQGRSLQELFIRLFRKGAQRDSEFWPLRGIDLTIQQGDTIGIIGPNGTGKSTLLKLITGIIQPTTGDVLVQGRLSSLLELGAGFHPDLTGRENIYLNASIYGLNRGEIDARLQQIIDFSELERFIDMPVKHYSSGMYVRLGFAVAIHTDPQLLLVDEVLAVGDARFQAKCIDAIQRFREGGGTILLVSHDVDTIRRLCNRALWIQDGLLRADGHPTDVVMAYRSSLFRSENTRAVDGASDADFASPVPARGTESRWGSGAVDIVDVTLLDGEGAPCEQFFTGDVLNLRLRYFAPEPTRNVAFGMALHDQNGVHVTGPNTQDAGLEIPLVDGAGEVVLHVDSLALLEGGYRLSVAATSSTLSTIHDYHDRAYELRVFAGGASENFGLITLNGRWSHEPAARARPTQHSNKFDAESESTLKRTA